MDVRREIHEKTNGDELLACARLAVAFTHLQMAPWDSWGHEGDAADMAAFVIQRSKADGRLGMLCDSLGVTGKGARA